MSGCITVGVQIIDVTLPLLHTNCNNFPEGLLHRRGVSGISSYTISFWPQSSSSSLNTAESLEAVVFKRSPEIKIVKLTPLSSIACLYQLYE